MAAEFKISYGLYVITVKDGEKDNGCICNTVGQVTTSPNQISVTLNKSNYTTELLEKTGVLNVSILSEKADFSLFRHFGFQSGRDTDKFADFKNTERSENGLYYLTEGSNAFLSAKVVNKIDLGTHYMFIAEVTESKDLNDIPSATYAYYHSNIKPKTSKKKTEETVWVCTICGYEYKGEELPEGYICPICKHGVEAFEKNKSDLIKKGL